MDTVADWFSDGDPTGRLILTVLLVGALFVVRWLVLRAMKARTETAESFFRTKKVIAYAVTIVGIFGLARIWFGGGGGITTYLGILSAGIAIALADVLESLAGWLFIVTRRPFRIGDRIEIGGRRGDVVDIRAFRFSMLEIGAWVDADQSTGRLIHVPNGMVFSEQLTNYTEGFPYIWDEISVMVTFESDWKAAERIVAGALAEHAPDSNEPAIVNAIRDAGHQYLIRYRHLAPATYVTAKDSGVVISGRYLVGARSRRGVSDALWRSILEALESDETVDLAYPTSRTVLADELRVRSLGGESQA
ncbi:MAG: mechanosensitive ion channel [Acidimicrobiia bacterium]|nr:mechanosensitive ion channel [Acidimicrobiia bacterium]